MSKSKSEEGSQQDLRALPLEAQIAACEVRLGRRPPDLERVYGDVAGALASLGNRTPRQALSDLGITITPSDLDPAIGTTTFRAVLDLHKRTLTLYPKSTGVENLVIAHETFHALFSHIHGAHAEVCANLFATRVLDLSWYAGLLDLSDRLRRPW